MSKIVLMRNAPLLAGLSDLELDALAECLGKRTFARGMVIFHKGSLGQNLYIIESGRVRIYSLSTEGQEITINMLGPGEAFGELSLLDGLPRSAGAMAVENTVAYTLHRDDFLRRLDANPRMARSILEMVSMRLRYTTVLAESFAFMDAYGRVAAKLLELVDRYGVGVGRNEIELRLTQKELASWVAVSRESVNKVLGAFRDQGMIKIDGGVITIKDRASLEKLSNY